MSNEWKETPKPIVDRCAADSSYDRVAREQTIGEALDVLIKEAEHDLQKFRDFRNTLPGAYLNMPASSFPTLRGQTLR